MSGLNEELHQIMGGTRWCETVGDCDDLSPICRKRAVGAVWYLARLNRKCGSILLGTSAFSFMLAIGACLTQRPSLALVARGLGGAMIGTICGTVGYIQTKEAQSALRLTHQMLADMENGLKPVWCRKYSRICRDIANGVIARLITRLGRMSIVEYKGYNLWHRLNQKSRTA